MNSMMLVLAMSAGQGPAVVPPPTGYTPQVYPGAIGSRTGLMSGPAVRQDQTPGQPPPDPTMGEAPDPAKEDKEKKEDEEQKEEPWALMRILKGTTFGSRLEDHGIAISGWTEGNYTASTAHTSNLPVTFNDRANFWQMNQNFLRIVKTVDTSKQEFQMGGLAELILPGTDARFSAARGLLDKWGGDYRIDLFQAYVETFHPNLGPQGTSIKTGKFATLVGYELVQGAETPFLSRSYVFQYDPFTHTGALATTPLNDTWSVSNGLALGSDNFIGAPARLTYLGQLKWAPKEGKTNALFNVVVTDPTFDQSGNFPFYNTYNTVITHKFNDKLSGVVDATASHMDGVPNVGTAWWYGAAGYAIYKFNDKLTATWRNELFEDNRGVRTGFEGLYYETTLGVTWSPIRCLMLRPAIRYDHNFDTGAFEGKQSLFTACMDAIIRW